MEGLQQNEVRAKGPQQLPATQFVSGSEFGLPEGWKVELRPRYSPKYWGKVDQFFYELNTGKQYRSLISAQRRVLELEQNKQGPKITEVDANYLRNSGTRIPLEPRGKKQKKSEVLDLTKPPERVTWALSDAQNDNWRAYVGETMVPGKIRKEWTRAFDFLTSGR